MSADVLDSRYSWIRLGISLAVATVANVGIWAVVVVMPALQAEFGIDRAAASIPYVTTMLGFGVGNLVIGRFVDRFGVVAALIGASVIMSVSYALTAVSGAIWLVYALHFLIGFGSAAGLAPLLADISHWFARRRGIAVALAATGNYLAGAVWPVALSGLLVDGSWRHVYFALAGIVLVVMIPLTLCLRRKVPPEAMAHADRVSDANRQAVAIPLSVLKWLLAAAGIGCCVAMAMPQVHVVSFAADLGCTPAVGAQILSVMLLGGVASRIVFGILSDRLGGVKTLIISSLLQAFALSLYLPLNGVSALFVVSLIFGLSQGGIVPSYAIIVREYFPARQAGTVIGFVI